MKATLPPTHAEELPSSSPPEKAPDGAEGGGRGTVLIVDDAPNSLTLLLDCLGGAGLELRFAESGERALLQLDHARPDLILLDVLLAPGGLDGFETCRRIRARADGREVPILFMTALDDPADTLRGFAAGAVDYIAKPFRSEEVLARVRAHLRIGELRRALEEENRRRRAAEDQLRQSLDQGVIVADRDGHIRFATRRARELLASHFPASPTAGTTTAGDLGGGGGDHPTEAGDDDSTTLPAALVTRVACPGWGPSQDQPGGGEANSLRVRVFSEAMGSHPDDLVTLLLEERPTPPRADALLALGLTAREAEVLFWIAHGKTGAEIALILNAALKTVKKHTEHIFDKLGVDTRTAAAIRALEVFGTTSGEFQSSS